MLLRLLAPSVHLLLTAGPVALLRLLVALLRLVVALLGLLVTLLGLVLALLGLLVTLLGLMLALLGLLTPTVLVRPLILRGRLFVVAAGTALRVLRRLAAPLLGQMPLALPVVLLLLVVLARARLLALLALPAVARPLSVPARPRLCLLLGVARLTLSLVPRGLLPGPLVAVLPLLCMLGLLVSLSRLLVALSRLLVALLGLRTMLGRAPGLLAAVPGASL